MVLVVNRIFFLRIAYQPDLFYRSVVEVEVTRVQLLLGDLTLLLVKGSHRG